MAKEEKGSKDKKPVLPKPDRKIRDISCKDGGRRS